MYWAKHAMLDEVTRGTGKIVPTIQIQTVQNLEGGILTEIYVQEGSLVDKGQILMRLDDVQFSGKLAESRLKYYEFFDSTFTSTNTANNGNTFTRFDPKGHIYERLYFLFRISERHIFEFYRK